jgi:hypothetical protein
VEGLYISHYDHFNHPRVDKCARRWAWKARRAGVTGVDADELKSEAWRTARARLESGDIDDPVAFLCRVIINAAKMLMRKKREIPDDPMDGRMSSLAATDRSFDELEARMLLDQALRYLEQNWPEIWRRAGEALGRTERSEGSIRTASVRAIMHLVLEDTKLGMMEIIQASMREADAWWRADAQRGEPIKTVIERRRKRIARDAHWISYIVVYETLRWAWAHNPAVCRSLAAMHRAHLRLAEAECSEAARAALERHIDEVTRNMESPNPEE